MGHRNGIWKEDKIVYKDKCFECGSTNEIHYHHIIPFSKGGNKTIPLCSICHGKVHDRTFTNHREMVIKALKNKKDNGYVLGRPNGTKESLEKVLEKYPEIVKLYNEKKSIRETSRSLNVAINTVNKVYKILYKKY
jgi:hypothetical protein